MQRKEFEKLLLTGGCEERDHILYCYSFVVRSFHALIIAQKRRKLKQNEHFYDDFVRFIVYFAQ